MENLIFFKEGESLKERIKDLHFSSQKRIQLLFPFSLKDLEGLIEERNIKGLIYFLSDELNIEIINWLKYYCSLDPDLKIVLFSNPDNAMTAWQIGVFHFEPYPVLSSQIIFSYKKFSSHINQGGNKYSIRTPEGVFNLNVRDIIYIQAAGNYPLIQFRNGKNKVLTRQLGTYSDLLEMNSAFERVHRSLIINKTAVKKINANRIYFHKSEKSLEVSKSLEARLKKNLFSYG